MKLRQKLAIVLASAMIITSVPVVTMAKSTNDVTKVLTVEKDKNIGWTAAATGQQTTSAGAVELKIKANDGLDSGDEFYLKLENGKWASTAVLADVFGSSYTNEGVTVKVTRNSDSELKVQVMNNVKDNTEFKIPVMAIATGGNVKLTVIPETTTLTGDSFIIAVTPEEAVKGTVTVGDAPSFYTSGALAPITVEEVAPGTFNGLGEKGFVKVTLNHGDFEFTTNGSKTDITVDGTKIDVYPATVKQTGTRGLSGITTVATAYVDAKDAQVMYIKLPENTAKKSRGVVEFSGIQVRSTERKPETGDLKADIEGVSVNTKADAVVAKVAEYGVSLTMKDDKAVKINEGRASKITFTLSENVEDSMAEGAARTVIFTLGDNAHFNYKDLADVKSKLVIKNADGDKLVQGTDYEIVDVIEKDDVIKELEVKFNKVNNTKIDKFKFEDVLVHTTLGEKGDVTLTAEGRAIDKAVETTAIEIVDVVDWKADSMTVKVGLKEQKGGKIVIEESDKGIFTKGGVLVFEIEKEDGITFTDKPEVKVTAGDLKLGDITLSKDGKLEVEVKRASKEASTVEIEGFKVKVDRTVPQGSYELKVGGTAITDCNTVAVKDFFVIGTPNTEDITNQVKKVDAIFTIASTEYVVNGNKLTMDAAPYISADSKTMVPVRYVSNAFGIDAKDILFSDSTVTIIAGARTIQMKVGSDVATLNGVPVKMAGKAELSKENRLFVPIAEIGRLLGVPYTWDNATKTVTFSNK